ncbi:MAG: hypothetical protein Q8R55_06655 [Candidatus Taylorbacteria bacterium]|nr:hypothetical protein [Candidatus Taylorbacteria bacterium]
MTKISRTAILLSFLVTLGFGTNLYAQNIDEKCRLGQKTVVFFGNGLDTIKDIAFDGKTALKRAIKKDVQDGKLVLPPNVQLSSICYQVAYNTDEFSKIDWIESYVQALGSATTDLWLATARLIPMPKFLEDSFIAIALGLNDINYVISQDLQNHVTRYQQEIAQNRKVIVVPHSQGNFYANAAYRTIFGFNPTDKLAIVSVANPDSFIADDPTNTNYTTFFADFIVAVPGALAGNTRVDEAKCDTSPYECHGFIESYLVGTYSRAQILGQIVNAIPISTPADVMITKTDTPDPVVSGNNLTYTLTVGNVGGSSANNVAVTDTLPLGLTNIQCSLACSASGNVITVQLGSLAPSAQVQFQIFVKARIVTIPTSITNTATVSTTSPESNTANNTFQTITTVNPAATSFTFVKLHDFSEIDGSGPGYLLQSSDGNFYGTSNGGISGGTIFKVDSSGTFTTLFTFSGSFPLGARLIETRDGSFYGTAPEGPTSGCGVVFRFDLPNQVTFLPDLIDNLFACNPNKLVEAPDGTLWGTTAAGGVEDRGTIFKMDRDGNAIIIYSFTSDLSQDGIVPLAGLTLDEQGEFFYGTTNQGGTGGTGNVFRIDTLGNLTGLYSFPALGNWLQGFWQANGLIQASDVNFYGVSINGSEIVGNSSRDLGTVFRMTPAGQVTVLHSFRCEEDGCFPIDIIQANDGNFYGVTQGGGLSDANATIFRMDTSGNLTTLVRFQSLQASNGLGPRMLIQGSDGIFYGVAVGGGAFGRGVVFRLVSQ